MVLIAGLVAPLLFGNTESGQTTVVDNPPCPALPSGKDVFLEPELRVLSVNLAHGRKDGLNQALQSGETARRNVQEAAELLRELDADVIALQEADAPSRWSGSFDHVEAVANVAGYDCRFHGVHATGRWYNFGTALLSRYRFTRAAQHDFIPTPPTTRKGFVATQIQWNPAGVLESPIDLTLVSLHLDFSRRSSRESQFAEMTEVLAEFPRPLVLMGDFNTEWDSKGALLQAFAATLDLQAWAPESDDYGTYKDGSKRLDWILVSKDLGFAGYRVLEEVVSDHQPVWAQLRLLDVNPEANSAAGQVSSNHAD